MPDRPNILYIFADQHAHHAMSCAGNTDLHTPNMDALAGRGVRFTNAYCAFPLCTPSRVSMLSGKMPSQLGCDGNAVQWDDADLSQTLGRVLTGSGYACAYAGKWHAGGERRQELGRFNEEFGFEFIAPHEDPALPGACDDFFRRGHDKPFYLAVSFDNPHNICQHGRSQSLPWGEVEDEDTPVSAYPNLPANFALTPYEPEMLELFRHTSPKTQRMPAFTPDRWRRYRYAYNRMVEKVDTAIGQILGSLEDAGLSENTIVIYSADHGEMAGSHQCSSKSVLYRESVGVPLIIADPRLPGGRRGSVSDALVTNGLDLLPTVCDYAQADPPEGLLGKSWRPLVDGDTTQTHAFIAAETTIGALGNYTHGVQVRHGHGMLVRTPRHSYMCYDAYEHREQLFDVKADPGEMVNLAIEARHRETLNDHRALLRDWLRATGHRFGGHYWRGWHASVPGINLFPLDKD